MSSSSSHLCNASRFGQHSADDKKPMLQRMLDGELYRCSDPLVQTELEQNEFWLARFNAALSLPVTERNKILRERLGHLGEGSSIRPPFFCDHGRNIFLGEDVFLNYNCCVLDVCRVDIGDKSMVGPAVQIYAADHPRDRAVRDQGWEYGRPVRIGRGVWVGGGAVILPGVTVGDGAIIGAYAVVTRDVPEGATVVGNPARQITKKEDQTE
ncbi:hypothetical protein niasHS_005956 [Heterodera schachtii]|uniref:Maltose/galactoside acetyltransferase domain-containing protein n=2 Tax=Heterodera TaxID=34509 RepID=A0ABD2JN12_HETSC